nr:DUF3558 domain-containing protein [Streptoalloteichus tenebrarius]
MDSDSAPRVSRPLSTEKFQQDPCGVLSPAQLRALNISKPGEPSSAAHGPSCVWRDSDGTSKMSLFGTFIVKGDGLPGLYARRGAFKVFEPLEIDGRPAVIANHSDDFRSKGKCDISVGLTDQLVYEVQLAFNTGVEKPADFNNPCGRAQTVAAEMIKTMKAGG